MNLLLRTLLLLGFCGILLAQEDEAKEEGGERPDPMRTLAALNKANAEKDVTGIGLLLRDISEIGQTSKSAEEVDPLAAALVASLKIAKGNLGTTKKILTALGELRSKTGAKALGRIAFKKKTKNPDEEDMQAAAVLAIAKMRDTKLIKKIADVTKHRRNHVAKSAYESFKEYGPSKARVRKNVAEILMKRLEAEYPSAGGQGSGNVSKEAQERWAQLQTPIVNSLQAVCRQDTINDIENWREWWKENKRGKWKDD